jgi:hypothetical protein
MWLPSFVNRLLGVHTFPDGSVLRPFSRETILFVDKKRKLEIDFVFDGSGKYNVYLDLPRLRWIDPANEDGETGISLIERESIASKVEQYCKQRAIPCEIHK